MRSEVPVELRPGTGHRAEALCYADLENSAADGGSAWLYGSRWRELLAHLYRCPDTLQSHRRTRIAWAGDRVVGQVTFIGFAEYARCARATRVQIRRFLGWRVLRPAGLAGLRSLTGLRLGPTQSGGFHLGSLAVVPDWRRAGVASDLLGTVERIARDAGASHLSLDLAPGNDAARALYHRHGFREVESGRWRIRRVVGLRKPLEADALRGGT